MSVCVGVRLCVTRCDKTCLCRQQLWDFVRVIESCIVDWHATPWQRIDTDDVEHECKKFTRDLRTLDKCIRDWAPYVYIVAVLRELVASLRAVTELQNPAITERHWLELMQLAKVRVSGVASKATLSNYKCAPPQWNLPNLGVSPAWHIISTNPFDWVAPHYLGIA